MHNAAFNYSGVSLMSINVSGVGHEAMSAPLKVISNLLSIPDKKEETLPCMPWINKNRQLKADEHRQFELEVGINM